MARGNCILLVLLNLWLQQSQMKYTTASKKTLLFASFKKLKRSHRWFVCLLNLNVTECFPQHGELVAEMYQVT